MQYLKKLRVSIKEKEEQVSSFRYLGIYIREDMRFTQDIVRITMNKEAFYQK